MRLGSTGERVARVANVKWPAQAARPGRRGDRGGRKSSEFRSDPSLTPGHF